MSRCMQAHRVTRVKGRLRGIVCGEFMCQTVISSLGAAAYRLGKGGAQLTMIRIAWASRTLAIMERG
jgi:hypothetical protein